MLIILQFSKYMKYPAQASVHIAPPSVSNKLYKCIPVMLFQSSIQGNKIHPSTTTMKDKTVR